AMSVEICAVTEISSADGTAASTIQRAACAQLGAGVGAALAAAARGADCSISRPDQAISAISTMNSAAQTWRSLTSAVNGSTTNGYEISARKLPTLLAA